MRNLNIRLFVVLLSLISFIPSFAMEGFVKASCFYQQKNSFVEIDFIFFSLQKNQGINKLQQAELTCLIKCNNQIVKAEKFLIHKAKNSSSGALMHLWRTAIASGEYEIETHIVNTKDTTDEITIVTPFHCKPFEHNYHLSDLQVFDLITKADSCTSDFCKKGFYYEPLYHHSLLPDRYFLNSYIEVYINPSFLNQKYFLKYILTKNDSLAKDSEHRFWIKTIGSKEEGGQLEQFDVSDLTSGEYTFTVQLLGKNKSVLSESKTSLLRYNPFWDKMFAIEQEQSVDKNYFLSLAQDSVTYAIKAIVPIISSTDFGIYQTLKKKHLLKEQQMFLYQMWKDKYPENTLTAYQAYMKVAKQVDNDYKTGLGYGFETDRGVMYLRYGKPDEVIEEPYDNGAFPYEIWKYNKVKSTGQSNVKFLFYNTDLAGGDFRLLHSTARGERFNPKWEIELYKNVKDEFKGRNIIDATQVQETFNRRARDYFNR